MNQEQMDYLLNRVDSIVTNKMNSLDRLIAKKRSRLYVGDSLYGPIVRRYYETESKAAADSELDLLHELLDRIVRDCAGFDIEGYGMCLRLYADVDEPYAAVYDISRHEPLLKVSLPHLKLVREDERLKASVLRRQWDRARELVVGRGRETKDRIVLASGAGEILDLLRELEGLDVSELLKDTDSDGKGETKRK